MTGGRREDEGRMEGGRREDEGRTESGRREDEEGGFKRRRGLVLKF
jgi:hypothetical protein